MQLSRKHNWVALLALAGAVASRPARADDQKAAAEAAFEAGKQRMVEGRFAEACPKLEESLKLEAGVGTMLYLAACYENTGRTASAWAEFRAAEALATRLGDPRAAVARERAERLEPHLARLTIVVPPALRGLEGLSVKRDDLDVGPGLWGTPIAVDPGVHRITVAARGKAAFRAEVTIAAEDARASIAAPNALEDDLGAAPPVGDDRRAAADEEGKGSALSPQRVAAIAVGGAGVVAIGVSLGFGLSAKSHLDDSNADDHCRGDLCDAPGTEARNAARQSALVSTIFFFGGLAALGGGAALWLTAKTPPPRTAITPSLAPNFAGIHFDHAF